jgi:hypothetical protein
LKAHWGAIAGADFFTTEVWTWRGHPEALFMEQIVRVLTMADDGVVDTPHVLICDRDRKWSGEGAASTQASGYPRAPHS